MKKIVVLLSALVLTFGVNVAMATPAFTVDEDTNMVAGITYSKPSTDLKVSGVKVPSKDVDSNVGLFVAGKVADKVVAVGERQAYTLSDFSLYAYDAYAKYQVSKNVHLIGGVRHFEDNSGDVSDSKALFGIAAETKVADKVTAYAEYKKADITTSYDIGVNYDMSPNTALNLSYRSLKYSEDNISLEMKGASFGVTYKF
jgi:hypothetical protein